MSLSDEQPLVSIGVPVFNRAECLPRCLEALLGQTYPNIEICISDNASTDASGDICRRLAAQDARVRFSQNAENLGLMENFSMVLENGPRRAAT